MDDMIRQAFGSRKEKEKTQRNGPYQFRGLHPSRSIGSQVGAEYEPLVDVFTGDSEVVVVAELLGVGKDYIEVNATNEKLRLWVNSPKSRYYKELTLPARVDPKTLATFYRNGVLEVRLRKQIGERLSTQ